jgi:hypothetical protein
MAEINQPTPIKPIWPSRREERPARREQPKADEKEPEEEEKPRQRPKRDEDDGLPHIDDYA